MAAEPPVPSDRELAAYECIDWDEIQQLTSEATATEAASPTESAPGSPPAAVKRPRDDADAAEEAAPVCLECREKDRACVEGRDVGKCKGGGAGHPKRLQIQLVGPRPVVAEFESTGELPDALKERKADALSRIQDAGLLDKMCQQCPEVVVKARAGQAKPACLHCVWVKAKCELAPVDVTLRSLEALTTVEDLRRVEAQLRKRIRAERPSAADRGSGSGSDDEPTDGGYDEPQSDGEETDADDDSPLELPQRVFELAEGPNPRAHAVLLVRLWRAHQQVSAALQALG